MSTASSSSFPSSSSSSDGSEYSVPSADEIQLYKVSLVETIRPLLTDVPRTPEPCVLAQPSALRILYTPSFDDLMGVYRTMRTTPTLYGGPTEGSQTVASARWLLVLAFALRQATSNYTVWKDRRDVVLNAVAFGTAHVDCLPQLAFSADQLGDAARAQSELDDVARQWLPHMPTNYLSDGAYSMWRAVHWELSVTAALAHLYHKQFQVWHHRKELIGAALGSIPASDAQSVLASKANCDAYLQTHHNLTFDDVDERQTIDHVLRASDPKNYHVWLHRSWFFHAFPFLLEPPSWSVLKAYADCVVAVTGQERVSASGFRVESDWCAASGATNSPTAAPSLYVAWPESPFTDELSFTTAMIQTDVWNNSAWCHRFFIIKEHLLPSLLDGLRDSPSRERCDELCRVLHALCGQEIYFALQWAAVAPCNECPYVHARCIAQVHQTVMLRVAVLVAKSGLTPEERTSLLTLPLDSPVKVITAAQERASPQQQSVTSQAPEKMFLTLGESLSWGEYRETFTLLAYVQDVTRMHLAPLADAVAERLDAVSGIRDVTEREGAVRQLLCNGGSAQYVLDNLHQCVAAQYHALFYFLEQCWLLFFSPEQRMEVHKARPTTAYAYDGISSTLEATLTSDVRTDATDATPTATVAFLEKEVRALMCVKELHILDQIRAKYWRHEASVVLHRHY